jgi:hypothetical protein
MSRTYRRKNDFYWDRGDHEYGTWTVFHHKMKGGHNLEKVEKEAIETTRGANFYFFVVPEGTETFKKAKAYYHRDHHSGHRGVPSWFINTYATGPNRAKNRTNCKNLTLDPDLWDDMDLWETDASKGIAWLWD